MVYPCEFKSHSRHQKRSSFKLDLFHFIFSLTIFSLSRFIKFNAVITFFDILIFIFVCIFSYLIGGISIARLITKKERNGDINTLGSGNPGTMNMARNFGLRMGLLTLVLDMLKAILPCLAAYFIGIYLLPTIPVKIFIFVAGLSVVLGHMFPVFYKFKGGKGIASTIGVFIACESVSDGPWIAVIIMACRSST